MLALPANPSLGQKWPETNPTHICTHEGPRPRWRLYGSGAPSETPGNPGAPGTPGTQWRDGPGAPDNAVGIDGDYHVDKNTGDVWKRTGGVYALTGFSMKGPQGNPGSSSGTFTLPGGAEATELAPQTGAGWAMSGTVAPTADGEWVDFSGASNLAAATKSSAGLKDNTTYDCVLEIGSYVGGKAQVMLYGATVSHLAQGAEFAANGVYPFQLTTAAGAGSLSNLIRIRATGTSGANTFKAKLSVKEVGAGGASFATRDLTIIVTERMLSVCDAGLTPENTQAGNDAAWANIMGYGRRRWRVPEGEYAITALPIGFDAWLDGDGRNYSIFSIRGTGARHGCDVYGGPVFDRSKEIVLSGLKLQYDGAGLTVAGTGPGAGNWSGLYVRAKLITEDVTVDGFTNDGVYFAPWDENEATGTGGAIDRAAFFTRHTGLYARNNGRDGIVVRRGANAHKFYMIQASNNGRRGVYHFTDGYGTYSNTFEQGQCSYNGWEGWYFNNGTNIVTSQIYAEQNGCITPGNNGTAYGNTLIDFHIGDNCTDSDFVIGAIFGNTEAVKLSHIRLPAFNPSRIKVREGGRLRYGTW